MYCSLISVMPSSFKSFSSSKYQFSPAYIGLLSLSFFPIIGFCIPGFFVAIGVIVPAHVFGCLYS